MLKLKRVQILGFKSFCDRTDVQLSGAGIAAIVGPNGCGKSNISDAITWVLGEQSAKSLRGIKMEDVIFAGTRTRKPTGMAEVSLTLVDPDAYGADETAEAVNIASAGTRPAELQDWDEQAERTSRADATDAATAEAQPGPALPDDEQSQAEAEAAAEESSDAEADPVVLKVRRRKFNRAPVRAGEITVTRRLFRSGESEYLLNGKLCRLRDIQDIFFGTGLSGENYAIIGQERIGQLLSSKPLDRRAILEEAAGITRFKTKKRLAELRLEASRQNLSRIDDIFDEVSRQMVSLKRQAAKAERYGQLRDELRGKLLVVLRSRLLQKQGDSTAATTEADALTLSIDQQAGAIESLDGEHAATVARGYDLDAEIRELQSSINETRVELERTAARLTGNHDRVADLTKRMTAATAELAQLQGQLASVAADRDGLRQFLGTAQTEAVAARQAATARQQEASDAQAKLNGTDREVAQGRQQSLQLTHRISQLHREEAQATEALAGLEREAQRLLTESEQARVELADLGRQRGQIALSFESVTDRLARLEADIAQARLDLETGRRNEADMRRRGDQLRAEVATWSGKRNSYASLIRDHSYSSETVRKLLKTAGANASIQPLGTMADFLEVDDEYGSLVDEFLKEELNYIVVKTWDGARGGIELLKRNADGRATFLVQTDDASAGQAEASETHETPHHADGVKPLRDCIRSTGALTLPLQHMLPKVWRTYLTQSQVAAQALALTHTHLYFLTPDGAVYHHATVSGGKSRTEGPLSLKRDLREAETKLDAVQVELSANEISVARFAKSVAELQPLLEARGQERTRAEREAANSGAAMRQMESEAARIEKRLADWSLHSERNRDAVATKRNTIETKERDAAQVQAERAVIDARVEAATQQVLGLQQVREAAQAAASAAMASLAVLEERRRSAAASVEQNERVLHTTQQRIGHLQAQLADAAGEQTRRDEDSQALAAAQQLLTVRRDELSGLATTRSGEATSLRATAGDQNARLRVLRIDVEAAREHRATLHTRAARLSTEIEHLQMQSLQELNLPAAELAATESIRVVGGDALDAAEAESRTLRGKMEAMGPVNMMALEEFEEASQRHSFLQTQRQDLLDSIANTQGAIRDIDAVSKQKFDEAFAAINQNFSNAFVRLFGGGQAMMKLTDETNSAESGIDLIASPPGKKLQNVLLLSGGEKALTALSLLVGIFEHQPSPFCILDEVDAPLDEANVGRFARLIHEMSRDTQFVVITHHKRTMSEADLIYGVTMQEPGVSRIVSVNLNRADRKAVA